MNGTESIMGSLGVAGLIAACWQQLRTLLTKTLSLVFVRVKAHAPLCNHISSYCYRRYRRSPFGLLTFDSMCWFVRPVKRFQMVGFERPSREPMLFWDGWKPILLSAMPENNTNGIGEGQTVTITGIRGLLDAESLIKAAIGDQNAEAKASEIGARYCVLRYSGLGPSYQNHVGAGREGPPVQSQAIDSPQAAPRLLGWNKDDIGPERAPGKALDALPFPEAVQSLVEELRRWLISEEWYRSRGIPWRRGWLLYGKPGTGKTSLVRGIAQDLDLPVCVFDLGTMNNREMQSYWREALNHAPCIALIEDIDAVFEGRKNVVGEDGGGLTFDCLLNCLSGIEAANGVFLVITTNRVELLDEALGAPRSGANGTMISTRPGRVDRALELTNMDVACRRRLAQRILADCPTHIETLVDKGVEDTAAQFQERCAQVALADHWSN